MGVALLLLSGVAAYFFAGGSVQAEPEPDEQVEAVPMWAAGDHLRYTELIERTDHTVEGTQLYPTGPVVLDWYITDVTNGAATVLLQRTWDELDGDAGEAWTRMTLRDLTRSGEAHPWTQDAMRPGTSWTTGSGPILQRDAEITSRVLNVETQDVLGVERPVHAIETEHHTDGVLVRQDTMRYAMDLQLVVAWRTTMWESEAYRSTEWTRHWILESRDQISVPMEPVATEEPAHIVAYNRSIEGDIEFGWFRSYRDADVPGRIFGYVPWNDPWRLVDTIEWTFQQRGASSFFLEEGPSIIAEIESPGQYRLDLRLRGDLNVSRGYTFSVDDVGEHAWPCGPLIEGWCSGPTLELRPGWSLLDYRAQTPGDIRLIDQDGRVVHEGPNARVSPDEHPGVTAVTPQWHDLTARTTVEATYRVAFHADW